jgi:uncharacterized repeat protein (TIGR01451 family)
VRTLRRIGLICGVAACGSLAAPGAPAGATVTPIVECRTAVPATANSWYVYYGYVNDGTAANIEFGPQNQVLPGFGFQGQPTIFNIGSYPRVFKATFNADVFSAIAWDLAGIQAIATLADTAVCSSGATGPASDVTLTGATLNGTVMPGSVPTSWNFDYGPTIAYGSSTPPQVASGALDTAVSEPISGLAPDTTYHYRLVAQGQENTVGEDRTFTTPAAPLPPPEPQLAPDLALTRGGATKARAGRRATITLTVSNRGPGNATGVELLQSLPAGLRFVSGAAPGGTCTLSGAVRCPVGTVPEGGSASASIVVKPKRPGRFSWWATAAGAQPEARAADNVTAGTLRVRKKRRRN